MREIGTVKEYDGYSGTITNQLGDEYILLKKEIMDNEIIKTLDQVSFVPEEFIKYEIKQKIARLVKKQN